MSAGRAILALNTGSSSLKFALYHAGAALTVPARGEVENSDSARHFIGRDSKGAVLCETSGATADFAATLDGVFPMNAISKLIQASDAQASSRSSRMPISFRPFPTGTYRA